MPKRSFLLLIALLLAGLLAGTAGPSAAEPATDATPVVVRLGEGDLLTGIPGDGPLTVAEVRAWLGDLANHRELLPLLPMGLDEGAADLPSLSDNPLTRAKIELGRQLYFDPRLSKDGTVSCASCHSPEHGFAFPTRFGVGIEGQQGTRNSPTAANRLLSREQFWDGRADSLEAQAVGPMSNPIEMGFTHEAVVEVCERLTGYRVQFERLFDEGVTIENVGKAIASFERVIVSGPSPWDHHRRLKKFEAAFEAEDLDDELATELDALQQAATDAPLSQAAVRGAGLFFGDRTGCTQCHAGANFSDERYHNLGVGLEALGELREDEAIPAELEEALDWGRYAITKRDEDRGAFKTPGLRNVAQTAPYLHDGSAATLAEVVALYVEGGHANPFLSPLLEPLDLSEEEQADLVAFLESLTGDWPAVETGRLPADAAGDEAMAAKP